VFGTNKVPPEPYGQTYGFEPRRMVKSILGNVILTNHPIASVFMFYIHFSKI
jgi:hypothetical protein